ncbi:hypothetical protein TNCV_622701 [Trichonephila clavipes]|nr:hypothetical protein TNCV_622701 [Trichonephila clavipes]
MNTRKIWRLPYTIGRESCLPEEILVAWERKWNTETDVTHKGSRTLEHSMTFLRLEVQEEEMCSCQNPVLALLPEKEIPQLKGLNRLN